MSLDVVVEPQQRHNYVQIWTVLLYKGLSDAFYIATLAAQDVTNKEAFFRKAIDRACIFYRRFNQIVFNRVYI